MPRSTPISPAPSPTSSPPTVHVDAPDTPFAEVVVRAQGQGDFLWPPAPPGTITPPPLPVAVAKRSRLVGLVDSIETTLLGRTALSFARQASRDGWRADAYGVYCWRCGGAVGSHEVDGEGCAQCRNTKLHWDQAIRLSTYDGLVRDAVLDLKFHRWRTTGRELGAAIGDAVLSRMERSQVRADEVVVIPIPMSNRRRIGRGVDHTRVLAEGAQRQIGCPVCRVLAAKHRPEQVGLSMTARGRNIKGAFRIRKGILRRLGPNCRVVVLIDDVRTTGATMTSACKALTAGFREISRAGGGLEKPEIWIATAGVTGGNARDRQILKI